MNGSHKHGLPLIVAGAFFFAAFVCLGGCSSKKTESGKDEPRLMQVTFSVPDMDCTSCAMKIKMALEHYAGVEKAYANFLEKEAWARYDPSKIDVDLLRRSVKSLGFKEVTIVSNEPYVPEPIPGTG